LEEDVTLEVAFDALQPRTVSGEILQADKIQAYNEFGKAPAVAPAPFKGATLNRGVLSVKLPAASVVVLEVR
ncbi:MAG: alpha-N-arabinofuranosidase, partial [Bacteroidales bacterium]|nr:alpha-N-arabinofuranosidase [Bacteroidales bacterium]